MSAAPTFQQQSPFDPRPAQEALAQVLEFVGGRLPERAPFFMRQQGLENLRSDLGRAAEFIRPTETDAIIDLITSVGPMAITRGGKIVNAFHSTRRGLPRKGAVRPDQLHLGTEEAAISRALDKAGLRVRSLGPLQNDDFDAMHRVLELMPVSFRDKFAKAFNKAQREGTGELPSPLEVFADTFPNLISRVRRSPVRLIGGELEFKKALGSPSMPVGDTLANQLASEKVLREQLQERGFDSIIYRNFAEEPGTLSVVTLDPKKFKPKTVDVIRGSGPRERKFGLSRLQRELPEKRRVVSPFTQDPEDLLDMGVAMDMLSLPRAVPPGTNKVGVWNYVMDLSDVLQPAVRAAKRSSAPPVASMELTTPGVLGEFLDTTENVVRADDFDRAVLDVIEAIMQRGGKP